MSGFLSRRFLEARAAAAAPPIDHDRFCRRCGFNLRGLKPGGACPECGRPIPAAERAGDDDPYLDLPEDPRARVRRGLRLAAIVLVVAALAKWCYLVPGAFAWTPELKAVYRSANAALACAWVLVVAAMLPAGWAAIDPRYRRARRWIIGGSLGWIPGCLALAVLAWTRAAPNPPALGGLETLLAIVGDGGRFLGGLAAVGLFLVHERAAELGGLEVERRRFAAAAWMLVPTSLLGQVFPPQVALFTMVLVAIVAFFWAWAMLVAADGCRRTASHLAWAAREVRDAAGRDERVAAARESIDADVRARIRPFPDRGRRE